ncbi:hypothetical protein CAJAP_05286 [Camponotus japonicus]
MASPDDFPVLLREGKPTCPVVVRRGPRIPSILLRDESDLREDRESASFRPSYYRPDATTAGDAWRPRGEAGRLSRWSNTCSQCHTDKLENLAD